MTPREYFELAYKIDRAVRRRQEIASKHRDSLYGRSIDYSEGSKSRNCTDTLGEAIANICSYEKETDWLIAQLVDIRFEIEGSINEVQNKMQRDVLTYRYLLYDPWKNKCDKDTGKVLKRGIKEKTGYSLEAVYKFHSAGLKKITVPEKITVKYSEIQKYL